MDKKITIRMNNGITLVSLVVTIIILLILAGVSLNLVAGSSGLLGKATNAADETKIAKLKESLELSKAEVLIDKYSDGEYGSLDDYIRNKIETSTDGKYETGSGTYTKGENDELIYTDNSTGDQAKLVETKDDDLVIKEIIYPDGTIKDVTTEESLMDEFEKAIRDVYADYLEYLKNKGLSSDTYNFASYLKEQTKEDLKVSTGGYFVNNGDGTYDYIDTATIPNTLTFVVEKDDDGLREIALGGTDYVTVIEIKLSNEQEDDSNLPIKDLKDGDIKFTFEPEDWTNGAIKVTAIPMLSEEELEGYTLQTSMNGRTWRDIDTRIFENNGTLYVRLIVGKRAGTVATTEVTKIDKIQPKLIAKDNTAKTITIIADDSSEKKNSTSGVKSYRVAITKGEDGYQDFEKVQERLEYKIQDLTPGATHYITVQDVAGNYSETIEVKTRTVLEQLLFSKGKVDEAMKKDAESEGQDRLYDYLKEKGEYEVEDFGKYYIEEDKIYYKDYDTEAVADIIVDKDGNLIVKNITTPDGNKESLNTPDVIRTEIEVAVDKIYKEYKEDKEKGEIPEDTVFDDYLKDRIESGEDLDLPNGGTFDYDDKTKFKYTDKEGNETNFIPVEKEDHVDVILKEYKDVDTGKITDLTTEKSLQEELEKVLAELRKDYEKLLEEDPDKTKDNYGFRDYVEDLAGDEHKFEVPSTGGTITSNGDGTFVYEDATTPPNSIGFTIKDNGEVEIGKVSLTPPVDGSSVKDPLELQEGDIIVSYSTTEWTTEPVTVTASINEREGLNIEGYIIRTSKRPSSGWVNQDTQTYTVNGDFYVQLYNPTTGDKVIATATGTVTNIDLENPEITINSATSYNINFTMQDSGSGVSEYQVTKTPETPTGNWISVGTPSKEPQIIDYTTDIEPETTYYVWAKDRVEHIVSKEVKTEAVPTLTQEDVTFEYSSQNIWNKAPVTITATVKNIPTTADGEAIYEIWGGNTENKETWFGVEGNVITITFDKESEAEKFYIAFKDKHGNYSKQVYASETITGIDDKSPVVDEVFSNTSYSYTITATDSFSGLGGYILTDLDTMPAETDEGWKLLDYEKGQQVIRVDNEAELAGKTKYVWVKDRAGNISESSKLQMKAVPNLVENDFTVDISPDGATNVSPITFTFDLSSSVDTYKKNNYELVISKVADGSSLEEGLTTTLDGNGHIYLFMKDKNGAISEEPYDYFYENYDNVAPTIIITGSTTNSITYNISDTHLIAEYAFKQGTHETEPLIEEWKAVEAKYLDDRTETGLANNATYTIWAKDTAGNVNYKEYTTQEFEPIEVSVEWDGTTKGKVTVTSEDTSDIYYIVYAVGEEPETPPTDITELTKYTEMIEVESGSNVYMFRWDGTNMSDYNSTMVCKPSQVTFNLDGGEGGPESKEYAHLSQVPLTPQPTKTGYTFQGWTTEEDGEVVYDTNTTTLVMQLEEINLYAIWAQRTDIRYTVEHYKMDINGNYPSTPISGGNFTGTSEATMTLESLAYTYTGFTYSYGQVNGTTVTTTTIAPDGSTIIKLYYSRNKYRFTLENESIVNTKESTQTQDLYYGATITLKGTLPNGYTGNIKWIYYSPGVGRYLGRWCQLLCYSEFAVCDREYARIRLQVSCWLRC